MRRIIIVGIVLAAALFILIQLVPVGAGVNPPVEVQIPWESAQTEALVRAACLDCHSHETRWPWYSRIAPVSWLVAYDVRDGRDHMNFSTGEFDLEEIVEEIERGTMPPAIYKPLHPDANLSADQRQQLIAGLRATFGGVRGDDDDDQ